MWRPWRRSRRGWVVALTRFAPLTTPPLPITGEGERKQEAVELGFTPRSQGRGRAGKPRRCRLPSPVIGRGVGGEGRLQMRTQDMARQGGRSVPGNRGGAV